MRRVFLVLSLATWMASGHAQQPANGENAPREFDPPTTDDPFLIDGRSPLYQWPAGRHWLLDAPNDEERWRRLETYLDGMQGPMFEIGQRFVIFYQALRDQNYDMAIDIWVAIARVFVNAVTIRPNYKPQADAMFLRTQWQHMRNALLTRDADKIWQEFTYTKAMCQSCHEATNMAWANNQKVFQETVYPFDGAEASAALTQRVETDPAEIFKPCTGCHTVEAGGPNLLGPNLHGIFGRKFGSLQGYNYSDALKNTDLRISDETLNEWLTDSAKTVPGSKMPFPGLRTQRERDAVIGYLKQITQ